MARLTISDLEIERPEEPLELEMADGTVFELQDPKGVRVDVMVDIENIAPIEQVKAYIADGRWDEFVSHPEVDGYYFEAVVKRYNAHFGMGDQGNGGASSRSASGTARPSKRTSPKRVSR